MSEPYRKKPARKFALGDKVKKSKGSWWQGTVVGFFSTKRTPDGVCVQLFTWKDNGPVQTFPAAAMELVPELVPEKDENP